MTFDIKAFIEEVVKTDEQCSATDDWDAYEALLNKLYYSVPVETFERFVEVVNAANDPDCRCPK